MTPPSHKVQVRVKTAMGKGDLALLPYGGMVIPHTKKHKEKFQKEINKNVTLHESYMRGVTADIAVTETPGQQFEQ